MALTSAIVGWIAANVKHLGQSYPLTAPAEEDPSVAAIRIASKSAAQKQRRIIYNDDGAMGVPYDTPEEFYKPRLNQVTDTHVDAVFYATGGSGTLMGAHRSEVGESYSDAIPADVADPTARQLRDFLLTLGNNNSRYRGLRGIRLEVPDCTTALRRYHTIFRRSEKVLSCRRFNGESGACPIKESKLDGN